MVYCAVSTRPFFQVCKLFFFNFYVLIMFLESNTISIRIFIQKYVYLDGFSKYPNRRGIVFYPILVPIQIPFFHSMGSRKLRHLTSEEIVFTANNLNDLSCDDDSDLDKDFVPNSTDSEGEGIENSFVLGRSLAKIKKKNLPIPLPFTQASSVKLPVLPTVPTEASPSNIPDTTTQVQDLAIPGPSGLQRKRKRNRSESPIPVLNPTAADDLDSDSDYPDSEDSFHGFIEEELGIPPPVELNDMLWSDDDVTNFMPRHKYPEPREGEVLLEDARTPLQIFHSLFTPTMIEKISLHTNERIDMYHKENRNQSKNSLYKKTSPKEIQVFLAISIIMGVNKLPDLHCYWSNLEGMGNPLIKRLIARDRFCFIHSRLYLESPQKPADCSKTYYLNHLVKELLSNFRSAYTDSSHQSIDEAMVAFKGRSSLKQYMPAKPVKRGIKLWQRNYATTGYTYDLSIYCGRTGKFTCCYIFYCIIMLLLCRSCQYHCRWREDYARRESCVVPLQKYS